ncbi:aspartate-semialdehyde dehydrogenase [Alteripontixanthobacter maritimus]|uniref:aspartate-semialdehyde dehydrogenase n=1 Tax=Alteripontixanthobacter maritimus TaxID=2161824 RepID=UPI0011C021A0|nr:aspartate-semialdehyde dehydrogenase [Alteripontixanthobacter maritimus]
MCRIALAASALALASACGSDAPSPLERQQRAAQPAPVAQNEVRLSGTGITAGRIGISFSSEREPAQRALTAALGEAQDYDEMPECGSGPMESARYGSGLTVNYQDGKLVGWYLRGPATGITLEGGVALGMTRTSLEQQAGYFPIEGSSLGEEFTVGDAYGGFTDGGAVTALYAGQQCFFR